MFAKRRFIRESFSTDSDSILLDEFEPEDIIKSELDSDEEAALIDVGEEFTTDSDKITKVMESDITDVAGNKSRALVIESFKRKWCIRDLKTESSTAVGASTVEPMKDEEKTGVIRKLWERFLKWLEDAIAFIVEAFGNMTLQSKKYKKVGAKLEAAIKEKATGNGIPKKERIVIKGSRAINTFFMDNDLNSAVEVFQLPKYVNELSTSVAAWVQGKVDLDSNMVTLDAKNKRSFERSGYEDLVSMKGTSFFKKTSRKLKKMGPEGSEEEQVLFPILGNAYIHCFKYNAKYHVSETEEWDNPIVGMRYISTEAALAKLNMGIIKEVEIPSISFPAPKLPDLIKLKSSFDVMVNSLEKIESTFGKTRNNLKRLKDESKKLVSEIKNKSLDRYERNKLNASLLVVRETITTTKQSQKISHTLARDGVLCISTFIKNGLENL